jgi:hypothetical protein
MLKHTLLSFRLAALAGFSCALLSVLLVAADSQAECSCFSRIVCGFSEMFNSY